MQPEIDLAQTDNKQNNLFYWLKVLFLAGLFFFVFYIAEHDPKMATLENFVQEIEDQESWAAGGNTMRRLAFLSCAGFGVLGLLMGQLHKFRWKPYIIFLGLYFAWTGASLLWSIDPSASMRRYMVMGCCLIGCVGISRFLTIEQVLLSTIITISGWLFLGLAIEIVTGSFRPHQGEHRFAGTLHPNLQAANLAVLCIAAFTMSRVRPKFKTIFYGVFMLGFLFLMLTKCRSGAALLPVSLMAIWLFTQPPKYLVTGFLIIFWGVSMVVLTVLVTGFNPIEHYSEVLLLGRGEETGSSLTGRLPLWEDLTTNYVAYRPWHGYGYGGFWTPRNIADIAIGQEWTISEAHSSYVDAMLQLGLIGVFLMVSVAFSALIYTVRLYKRTGQKELTFVIGGIVFCLMRGFTESGMGDPIGFIAPLFLALTSHAWNSSNEDNLNPVKTQAGTHLD